MSNKEVATKAHQEKGDERLPDSAILHLFDNPDDLADYCVADNEQQAAIVKKIVDRLTQEGKSIPGMACNIRHP